MASRKLKVGDTVRICASKPYSGDEPYPAKYIGMIAQLVRINTGDKYKFELTSPDEFVANSGFRRCELAWVDEKYIPPNPIEERIKKLYGKCKTTKHWAV